MKVLIVHNFYQSSSPSGEDIVFKNEVELLKKNGVNVVVYKKYNDEIKNYGLWDKFILPFKNIWFEKAYREIKELIKKEKPDIAHFHNTWYLISPSAYYACKDEGIPVVQTLHNFRIFCTNGLLSRDGKICEECIISGKNKIKFIENAIKYGCYRNSRVYSLPVALTQYYHWLKKTWFEKVDVYIALTEFSKRKFIEAGLPENKIFIKPNFLLTAPEPNYSHKNYVVFIGRISKEKGVNLLIDAFKNLPTVIRNSFHLKIIGDGPLRENLQQMFKRNSIDNIEFTGKMNFTTVLEVLRYSRFLIIPSACYEGFPMVIAESFACGKPVVASKLGAMPELIEDGKTGLLFEPGNTVDLAKKIIWMIEHEDECIEMGKNARKVFEEKYTAEKNFEILMKIYSELLEGKKCQRI